MQALIACFFDFKELLKYPNQTVEFSQILPHLISMQFNPGYTIKLCNSITYILL